MDTSRTQASIARLYKHGLRQCPLNKGSRELFLAILSTQKSLVQVVRGQHMEHALSAITEATQAYSWWMLAVELFKFRPARPDGWQLFIRLGCCCWAAAASCDGARLACSGTDWPVRWHWPATT
jgi:hypothetical protein